MVSYSSIDQSISRHITSYRRLLDLGKEIQLSTFVDTYLKMKPLLHSKASGPQPDLAAINYAVTRLPEHCFQIKKIILSQNQNDFLNEKFILNNQHRVYTKNRRRFMYYQPQTSTLGVLLNSDSDIDDLINTLLAYQVEIKKIPNLSSSQLLSLKTIFLSDYDLIVAGPNFDPAIKLYPPSQEKYQDLCHRWWLGVAAKSLYLGLENLPVYFVSSNSHSLVNIIGGFFNSRQSLILDFIAHNHPDLYDQWFNSRSGHELGQFSDFLFHVSGLFLEKYPEYKADKDKFESDLGVIKIPSSDIFPTDVQIIPLKALTTSSYLDPNLSLRDREKISKSQALIINIQYPLGIAAKYLLTEILNYFNHIKAVYIVGKAAILNGSVGDIQIPEIVLDEISNSIIKLDNIFNQYFPFKSKISRVLSFQKAACVYGTMLENQSQIENYQKSGFNIIEMESSNYLAAILEKYTLNGQSFADSSYYNINDLPIDLGIINYASDNPLTQNLGHETINFRGIETTYLSSLTVLQRIIDLKMSC